jgi:hypothetical protein
MNMKRWTHEDELQLLGLYSAGNSFKSIGEKIDKDADDVKERLDNIIYDLITRGKTKDMIASKLNTSSDVIMEMYQRSVKRRTDCENIQQNTKINSDRIIPKETNIFQKNELPKNLPTQPTEPFLRLNPEGIVESIQMQNMSTSINPVSQYRDQKIREIQNENLMLEAIIKNQSLKKQLVSLYQSGKLDKRSLKLLKIILQKDKTE